ncbi:YbjN domain-containing protein [Paenibacillus silviterrae]|uniref:YbjN domain-containing protein n=1 Tax=Paenibacillus silviterrae TaxID=3242194 RepID=UPI002543DABF|nr:YbjN domain-containing protein [Paenibacillus chinjuensis]
MNESIHARHLAELGFLKQYLEEAGLQSDLLEKSEEVPLNVLLAPMLKDHKGRDRYVNFSFVPFTDDELESIRLLQIYTTVPVNWKEGTRSSVEKLLLAINCQLAIGHFSIKSDDEVYYRYVYAAPGGQTLRREDMLELIDLFMLMLDMFSRTIDDVASGALSLASAMAAVNE